ncbi:MAG: flavodoxin/nitric oxide synthase [Clostridia bacterium]|jgi:menaquinone-dependent protoporphyrinogen IX oxidase|uniref:flavodoxin domain-containing protein n=1 Tax=Petroclostridium xylanilyticum TaxID=1792311 RepID=UPI000B985BD1|nr:flavodoxin domain-containing protein [Petroclostridium xylanilyticum]MBZ4646027.1 flavodoxin/nitric oxide synthase [Clostridia bacterium]
MIKDVIVYSTEGGTTKETAEKMKMAAKNKVDVFNIKDKPVINLNQYNRVFIGSGVYAGSLAPDVIKFIEKNTSILKSKKIIFFVHALGSESEYEKIVSRSVKNYIPSNRYEIFYLGGKVDVKKQNFFIRMMISILVKKLKLDPEHPNNIDEKKVEELMKCVSSTH